jgi:hypothetical protein
MRSTVGVNTAGAAVASKANDARVVVSTLPLQAAAGDNGRPDAYVQAPQGLFPAPMQQSQAAGKYDRALALQNWHRKNQKMEHVS